MKICSWDIGIKNLAYCLINHDEKDNTFTILDWDLINLIEDEEDQILHICECKKKDGVQCNNEAKLYFELNNKKTYYCHQHKKQFNINEYINDDFNENTKGKCQFMLSRKKELCNKKSKIEKNNMLFCNQCYKKYMTQENKQFQLKKITKKKASEYDKDLLSLKVAENIDSRPHLFDVNTVLIELQPLGQSGFNKKFNKFQSAVSNPLMKTVSCFVFHHFVTRLNIDMKKNIPVKFIPASNKIKIGGDASISFLAGGANSSNVYKKTKEISIEFASIISKNTIWENHLGKYQKQDDVSDSLIQAYHYLYFKNGDKYTHTLLESHCAKFITYLQNMDSTQVKTKKTKMKFIQDKDKNGNKTIKINLTNENENKSDSKS
jgi:hypothetical protein